MSSTVHGQTQWMTLGAASAFLGVHYTTLRSWADKGEIPVFRTPGGHRRFSVSDLRRFLMERAAVPVATDSTALVEIALGRVREQLQQQTMIWLQPQDDLQRTVQRQRGRQLFALAISYVLKPQQQERILEDGRELGWDYGQEAARNGLTLSATGRTVQFFRRQLSEAISDTTEGLDAEDVRIQQRINQFLDEILYAVLDGYECAPASVDPGVGTG